MDKLIQYIYDKDNEKFNNFKVVSSVYSKQDKLLTIRFIYRKDREIVSESEREELKSIVEEFVSIPEIIVDVKTRKALIDADVVKEYVFRFMQDKFPSICIGFNKNKINVKIENDDVDLIVPLVNVYHDFAVSKNFEKELHQHLCSNFFESFNITVRKIELENADGYLEEHVLKVTKSLQKDEYVPQFEEVEKSEEFIGELITEKPFKVESVKNPATQIAIAGEVRVLVKKSFASKQKDEFGQSIMKDYFSFNLVNEDSEINCVVFLPKSDIEKFETLTEGEFVIVFGDAELFNDKLNFKVKRISKYAPKPQAKQEIVYKEENEDYVFVKPEPYIMLEQSFLFDLEEKVNDFLLNNDVVVFDFETTGLEATVNEIIEIGAAKIVKGKITETFSVLIKPKARISQEITNITGITNEMVENSYSISQVLPDFYKFTKGCVLSAYNIAFDYNFLYAVSKKMGYNFDNRQIDTMYLARTKLMGLKNYKLKSVANALGVPLDNAHRAVFDAIATAEVFIKLSDDLK